MVAMEVDETISVVASIASRSAAESVSSGSASKKQALQQPSVDASFRRRSAAPALNALAVAFAANSIAYAVVENSAFRALLTTLGWPGDLPSRELVRNAVQHNSAAVRQDVIDLLKDAVVTLAADGWTHEKASESDKHCAHAVGQSAVLVQHRQHRREHSGVAGGAAAAHHHHAHQQR